MLIIFDFTFTWLQKGQHKGFRVSLSGMPGILAAGRGHHPSIRPTPGSIYTVLVDKQYVDNQWTHSRLAGQ